MTTLFIIRESILDVLLTLRARRLEGAITPSVSKYSEKLTCFLGSVETLPPARIGAPNRRGDHAGRVAIWGDRKPSLSCDQNRRKYPKNT